MKVVLLHDWITGYRGGERVLEAFCELFPSAPLYTLVYKPGSASEIIEDRKINTSIINKIPKIYNHYRKFLPFFPLSIKSLQIKEKADLVLSSSHCVIKGVQKPAKSMHISYVHSPMRYMYDQFDNYFGSQAPFYQRIGANFFRNYLTDWDKKSNNNVNHFIANSKFVSKRIQEYYERDSKIIHPFVDLADFTNLNHEKTKKKNYYIIVSAFAPNKKIDLAVKAFNELGFPLKIIGGGQQETYLKNIANKNIEFLGNLPRKKVIKYLSEAKALIFPGVEDFGITPLESLAAGTPVIAYKTGGVLETLSDKTALFFLEESKDSLINAIHKFPNKTFKTNDLLTQSQKFSKEKFKKEMLSFIEDKFIKY